jgi:hypothetical protein
VERVKRLIVLLSDEIKIEEESGYITNKNREMCM